MSLSRREFIRQLGIAFASLALTQCRRRGGSRSNQTVTCYTIAPPPTPTVALTCYTVVPSPTPTTALTPVVECYEAGPPLTSTPSSPLDRKEVLTDVVSTGDVDPKTARRIQAADARDRLRDCWLALDELAQQTVQDFEKAEQTTDTLVETHRAVLDELVSLDELGAEVAALVQGAFEEGAFHVWRNNAPITCYIALPVEYDPRDDLVKRSEALSGVSGDVDPEVVAKAQEALARDIAFFDALGADGPANAELLKVWQSEDIEASAQALEAAQFLGALLSEGAG